MSDFVLDNSVTMRWCFEDASTHYSESVLDRLLSGDQAYVPALWLYEVVSVLAKAQRAGTITARKAHGFLEDLRSLEIEIDTGGVDRVFDDVHRLAVDHGLSGYDAAYLELAARRKLDLATLDDDLRKAARAAGVAVLAEEG